MSSVPFLKASYQLDQPQLMASAGTAQGCWVVMVQDRGPVVVVAALQLRPAAPILATGLRPRRVPSDNCRKSLQTDHGRLLATAGPPAGNSGARASLPIPAPPPAVTQRPAAGRQRPGAVD